MDRFEYERRCLFRNPRFQRDVQDLIRNHPRRLDSGEVARQGEAGAVKAMAEKYPLVMGIGFLHPGQAYPLVFDPAFGLCVSNAIPADRDPPPGIVTRLAIEEENPDPRKPISLEAAAIHKEARRAFDRMSAENRATWRDSLLGSPVDMIFAQARVFLPIRANTTLKQVRVFWPVIEAVKRECYGEAARPRGPTLPQYEARLRVYDLVRFEGLSIAEAARRSGRPPRQTLRRFNEAREDIEGPQEALTPKAFEVHTTTCKECRKAQRSDDYCKWMRKQLGGRARQSVKAALVSIEKAEAIRIQALRGRKTSKRPVL